MCRNMVDVTGHEGVLTKGLNRDNHPNMGFLPVNGRQRRTAAMILTPIVDSTAIPDEILTMSRLPK